MVRRRRSTTSGRVVGATEVQRSRGARRMEAPAPPSTMPRATSRARRAAPPGACAARARGRAAPGAVRGPRSHGRRWAGGPRQGLGAALHASASAARPAVRSAAASTRSSSAHAATRGGSASSVAADVGSSAPSSAACVPSSSPCAARDSRTMSSGAAPPASRSRSRRAVAAAAAISRRMWRARLSARGPLAHGWAREQWYPARAGRRRAAPALTDRRPRTCRRRGP
jgi:hypothetical protein